MKKTDQKRILWVDDQIALFADPYIKLLRRAGFIVTTADSTKSALKLARKSRFDIFLVDLRMPEPDGVVLLREIAKIELQKSAILAALSSFLYLQQYRARVKGLGIDVQLIDKDFPPTDSKDVNERFLDPIRQLTLIKSSRCLKAREASLKKIAEVDPFGVSWSRFLGLSLEEKEFLLERAHKIASQTIQKEFMRGKSWVLLCGSPNTVAKAADNIKDALQEKDIVDYARRMDAAPYQFFQAPIVEDMWMDCHSSVYPTVTMQILSLPEGKPLRNLDVHFDTGSPMCFFSYEDLLEMGAIQPSQLIGKAVHRRKGFTKGEYISFALSQPAILQCQGGGGGTKTITMNGHIVRDWENGPYARFCDKICPYLKDDESPKEARMCPFRKGLVGRNLLTDNGVSLLLDSKEHKTKIDNKGGRK